MSSTRTSSSTSRGQATPSTSTNTTRSYPTNPFDLYTLGYSHDYMPLSRSNRDHMLISITRHRRNKTDLTFKHQCLLKHLAAAGPHSSSTLANTPNYQVLLDIIVARMDVDLSAVAVVRCMNGSGEICVVNGQESLEAAVMDVQNKGGKVVELCVVKNDDITNLPEKLYV